DGWSAVEDLLKRRKASSRPAGETPYETTMSGSRGGVPFALGTEEMSSRPGGLRTLLHLADARMAFAAGQLVEALAAVDAALAVDPHFVAAHALRRDIVARLQQRSDGATQAVVRSQLSAD